MSDPHADKIARRTLTRLTKKNADWAKAIERLPDEGNEAYYTRLEAIAADSSGAVMLITINEIAQRQRPPDDEPQPIDFTPMRRMVIPVVNSDHSKRFKQ